MGDRSISASERRRQLADREDRDRIEGAIRNEANRIPDYAAAGGNASVAAHEADTGDVHPQYLKETDAAATYAPLASPALTGTPTVPTQATSDNSTKAASTAYVQAVVAALVASSPAALDTLNELAAALGNDANFAATMTTALAGKAASVHTHAKADITDLPTLAAGTYTPTLTNIANVDSSTVSAVPWQYLRVGNTVTVSGRLDVDPTLGATTLTQLGISLPIASNLGSSGHLAGTAAAAFATVVPGIILADTANDRATLSLYASGTSGVAVAVQFTYQVI